MKRRLTCHGVDAKRKADPRKRRSAFRGEVTYVVSIAAGGYPQKMCLRSRSSSASSSSTLCEWRQAVVLVKPEVTIKPAQRPGLARLRVTKSSDGKASPFRAQVFAPRGTALDDSQVPRCDVALNSHLMQRIIRDPSVTPTLNASDIQFGQTCGRHATDPASLVNVVPRRVLPPRAGPGPELRSVRLQTSATTALGSRVRSSAW